MGNRRWGVGMSERWRVDEEGAGKRLDAWLATSSGVARIKVQRLIGLGCVLVDGSPATSKALHLREGQEVELLEPPREPETPEPDFAVRFEDDYLAVVAKPAGVVVHPAPGARSGTLVEALGKRMPLAPAAGKERAGVVHRLDKGTSGLLVFAKTDDSYRALVEMMRARKIERTYIALVAGRFRMPSGRIEAPVGRRPSDPKKMGVTASGREAITTFRVVEEIGDASLIEVKLHTGRTHQIRVHLAHIGHPVAGDPDYGRKTGLLAGKIGLARPFLHAARLRFPHPINENEVDVAEQLPEDLAEALKRARESAAGQ